MKLVEEGSPQPTLTELATKIVEHIWFNFEGIDDVIRSEAEGVDVDIDICFCKQGRNTRCNNIFFNLLV